MTAKIMEGVKKIFESKSKTFLAFCFCFIFGTGLASLLEPTEKYYIFIYYSFFTAIFFIAFFWRETMRRNLAICITLIFFAFIRYHSVIPQDNNYIGTEQNFLAEIVSDPKIKSGQAEYYVRNKNFSKKILVKLPAYPQYRYGDLINISCYLDKPATFPGSDFQYDKYLLSQKVSLICLNPETKYSGHKNSLIGYLSGLRSIVADKVGVLWPEPESSLIGGILYGDRTSLPEDVANNFSRVGLSHIVAVSGYNITIIAAALMALFVRAGLYRKNACVAAVIGIFLFVLFTGASASAVRAGIMGCVVLAGQYFGRLSRALPALVFASALMIFANPYILFWDVGFQLSALATAGILLFSRGDSVVKTTLCAIGATLPLILFHFGRLSVVALPVNIVILWLIPYLMFFSFISIILSYIFFPLAQLLAWLAGFGLKYILFIVNIVGRQSWASVEWKIPWWFMIMLYLIIYSLFYKVWQNKKLK